MLAVGATDWSLLPNQCFLVSEKVDLASARSRYFIHKIEGNNVICPVPELFSASLGEQPIFSPQILAFKIPNFFLEGNSGTKALDQEERRDFGYLGNLLACPTFYKGSLKIYGISQLQRLTWKQNSIASALTQTPYSSRGC